MTTVGLRELRQQASELLRRVEAGEDIVVTVAGRPSARLVPIGPQRWRTFDEVADVFEAPADPDWAQDRDLIDQRIDDRWSDDVP